MLGGILIIDYGSQYTQLIARRIREFNVYCEIHPYNKLPDIDGSWKAVILSGSPFSWRMGETFKAPLKRIFQDIIPNQIINRKKVGFPVQLGSIFPSFTPWYSPRESRLTQTSRGQFNDIRIIL